jgi:hypothetical protein
MRAQMGATPDNHTLLPIGDGLRLRHFEGWHPLIRFADTSCHPDDWVAKPLYACAQRQPRMKVTLRSAAPMRSTFLAARDSTSRRGPG